MFLTFSMLKKTHVLESQAEHYNHNDNNDKIQENVSSNKKMISITSVCMSHV